MDTMRSEEFIDYCQESFKRMNELREKLERLNQESDMFEHVYDEYFEMRLNFSEALKKTYVNEEVNAFIDYCRESSKRMNELREELEKLNQDSNMFDYICDEYFEMRMKFSDTLRKKTYLNGEVNEFIDDCCEYFKK